MSLKRLATDCARPGAVVVDSCFRLITVIQVIPKLEHLILCAAEIKEMQLRSFEGAVLFIDMLGFSALTRGKLTLGSAELAPWKIDPKGKYPHQLLAAKILIEFRKALVQTNKEFPGVRVAQLSDCAFLWAADVGKIADAGRYLMYEAALKGLLCRGGLAFGDIHEPSKSNKSLGAFIVGDAVTRAATYEAAGKGMRIFTDMKTATRVMKARPNERFQPLLNPLTGVNVDEWRWYAPSPQMMSEQRKPRLRQELERVVGCHTTLRFSPKLSWSATTEEGRRQIACSVAAVSDAMEQLSGNSEQYQYSVESLLLSDSGRSDAVCLKIQKKFVEELFDYMQRR